MAEVNGLLATNLSLLVEDEERLILGLVRTTLDGVLYFDILISSRR